MAEKKQNVKKEKQKRVWQPGEFYAKGFTVFISKNGNHCLNVWGRSDYKVNPIFNGALPLVVAKSKAQIDEIVEELFSGWVAKNYKVGEDFRFTNKDGTASSYKVFFDYHPEWIKGMKPGEHGLETTRTVYDQNTGEAKKFSVVRFTEFGGAYPKLNALKDALRKGNVAEAEPVQEEEELEY